MIPRFAYLASLALFMTIPAVTFPAEQTIEMKEDESQVAKWNRFAEALFTLHEKNISMYEIRETEETGHWGGEYAKGFNFRDISYHDAKSGRLVSRLRRNADKPENIEIIEVYIYGNSGRLARDFTAIYLPWNRNAPISTFINLHQYREGLHGFRQFDASGELLYEHCRGMLSGKEIDISLEEYQIDSKIKSSETYQSCFNGLPKTADEYIIPH